jgi:anti-sigma factor RsiW
VRCTDAQTLIESYVDGELDLVHTVEIEQHLGDCSMCAPRHQDVIELRSRIREEVPYFRASPDLQQRVGAVIREKQVKAKRSWVPIWT